MNRRGFFGALAAAPLVAVGANETLAAAPVDYPALGELRAVMVPMPDRWGIASFCVAGVETHIWTGEAWVNRDSWDGIQAHNKAIRHYR
jgi:hypothetical protein